jgi:hypothetical protein
MLYIQVQDAQHIAMKRVLKVIEKQKYLMENNEVLKYIQTIIHLKNKFVDY